MQKSVNRMDKRNAVYPMAYFTRHSRGRPLIQNGKSVIHLHCQSDLYLYHNYRHGYLSVGALSERSEAAAAIITLTFHTAPRQEWPVKGKQLDTIGIGKKCSLSCVQLSLNVTRDIYLTPYQRHGMTSSLTPVLAGGGG